MATSQLSLCSWYRNEPSFYTKIEEQGQSDHGSECESEPRKSWIQRNYSAFGVIAVTTAALSSISLLAITFVYLSKRQPASFVPDIPLETVIFGNAYSELTPAELAHSWDHLLPGGKGLLVIPDPSRYGLPPGMQNKGKNNVYGVTWTHEFHCLNMMRQAFMSLRENDTNIDFYHIDHCFDYLRQLILCHGDMTVEWAAEKTGPGERDHIDGYGIPHQCKNKDLMLAFVETNVPDSLKGKHGHVHGQ